LRTGGNAIIPSQRVATKGEKAPARFPAYPTNAMRDNPAPWCLKKHNLALFDVALGDRDDPKTITITNRGIHAGAPGREPHPDLLGEKATAQI
jgi:hypothetical protein